MAGPLPGGLTSKELSLLSQCADASADLSLAKLFIRAAAHLSKIHEAHKKNAFVNFRLAEAVLNVFSTVIVIWDELPPHSHRWLKGMMGYFCLSSDLESDFSSPIGMDDDVAIMNACLKLAGREDFCLNPEEFDDV